MKSSDKSKVPANTDEYIAAFPASTRLLLQKIRSIIKKAAPDAEELISYGMPAFRHHGMLVFFAGYQHHIGFYPGAGPTAYFKEELKAYKTSKGTVQFPLDKALPVGLITKIVKFRVKENEEKLKAKLKSKSK
jgi:uncharacterized protein YdhG (YjbR/CyaY superfamily)